MNNIGAYFHAWGYAHAVLAVAAIFLVCAGIDLLRQRFAEAPLLHLWDKHEDALRRSAARIGKRLAAKFHIE